MYCNYVFYIIFDTGLVWYDQVIMRLFIDHIKMKMLFFFRNSNFIKPFCFDLWLLKTVSMSPNDREINDFFF